MAQAMADTDAIRRLMLAVERLERAADEQAAQARLANEAMQRAQAAATAAAASREAEQAAARQAMHRIFEEQQRQVALALRPAVVRAWRGVVVSAAGLGLLALAFLVLLDHEYARLREARAQADAAEVAAQVQAALAQVEISACGGRPCLRLDRQAPVWTRGGAEYVLLDAGSE